MWSHRMGMPRGWISRVRVIVQSFLQGTLGYVVYEYMAKLQINNLELYGGSADVLSQQASSVCLSLWPKRTDQNGMWRAWTWEAWRQWAYYEYDSEIFVKEHQCDESAWDACLSLVGEYPCERTHGCYWTGRSCITEVDHYRESQCGAQRVPLQKLDWDLGYPLGDVVPTHAWNDMLFIYANVFIIACVANVVAFMTHDLALLSVNRKSYILDWRDLNEGFPFFRRFPKWTGLSQLKRKMLPMRAADRPGCFCMGCAIFAIPFLLVWAIFLFMFVLAPMVVGLFVLYPVRLSRFWSFILLVLMALLGVFLSLAQMVFLTFPGTRPRYALTWSVADGACVCGCSYSMGLGIHQRLMLLGLGVMVQANLKALRCLKGLRRSHWANLISVMFPIPVAVYAVEWSQLFSDDPCKGRSPGQPVQSEVAFDPFALMDEQPESRYTTISLRPEPISEKMERDPTGKFQPMGLDRPFDGPDVGGRDKTGWKVEAAEYIGCCGFPCLTGGYQAVLPSSDSEEEGDNAGQSWHVDSAGRKVSSDVTAKASSTGRWGWRRGNAKRRLTFGLLKDADLALARKIMKAAPRDLALAEKRRSRGHTSSSSSALGDSCGRLGSLALDQSSFGHDVLHPALEQAVSASAVSGMEDVRRLRTSSNDRLGRTGLQPPTQEWMLDSAKEVPAKGRSVVSRRRRSDDERNSSFGSSELSPRGGGSRPAQVTKQMTNRRRSMVIPAMSIRRAPLVGRIPTDGLEGRSFGQSSPGKSRAQVALDSLSHVSFERQTSPIGGVCAQQSSAAGVAVYHSSASDAAPQSREGTIEMTQLGREPATSADRRGSYSSFSGGSFLSTVSESMDVSDTLPAQAALSWELGRGLLDDGGEASYSSGRASVGLSRPLRDDGSPWASEADPACVSWIVAPSEGELGLGGASESVGVVGSRPDQSQFSYHSHDFVDSDDGGI